MAPLHKPSHDVGANGTQALITLSAFTVGLVVKAALAFSAHTASFTTTQALFDILAVGAAIEAFPLIPFAGFGIFAGYELVEGAVFSASAGAFAPGNALNMIGLIAFSILLPVLNLWLLQQSGKPASVDI